MILRFAKILLKKNPNLHDSWIKSFEEYRLIEFSTREFIFISLLKRIVYPNILVHFYYLPSPSLWFNDHQYFITFLFSSKSIFSKKRQYIFWSLGINVIYLHAGVSIFFYSIEVETKKDIAIGLISLILLSIICLFRIIPQQYQQYQILYNQLTKYFNQHKVYKFSRTRVNSNSRLKCKRPGKKLAVQCKIICLKPDFYF